MLGSGDYRCGRTAASNRCRSPSASCSTALPKAPSCPTARLWPAGLRGTAMVRGGRCGPGVAHQTLVPLLGAHPARGWGGPRGVRCTQETHV